MDFDYGCKRLTPGVLRSFDEGFDEGFYVRSEIREALAKRLTDSDEGTRGEAMVGLATRGDLGIVENIVSAPDQRRLRAALAKIESDA